MTIHSTHSPEGSDMDVSESDEEFSYSSQPTKQTTRAHEGMVVGLRNHIQSNSSNSATDKARVEHILQPTQVQASSTSYASVAGNFIDDDDDNDSVTSFHTAPNSPEREETEPGEVIDSMDIEPGQIVAPSSLEVEYAKLQKQLKRNNEIEAELAKKLDKCKRLHESLKLQLLEQKVRQSIASNRRPMMNPSVSTPTQQITSPPVAPPQQRPFLIPAGNRSNSSASSSRKGKQKASITAVRDDEPLVITQPVKRPCEPDAEIYKSKRRSIVSIDGTRSVEPIIEESPETKQEKREREREALISEEERALIQPDVPPYPEYHIQGRKDLARGAARTVSEYLANNPPTLKEMRLTLLNLQETSVRQARLTIEQEEFVKGLIRKCLKLIEDYMTLRSESFMRMMRKQERKRCGPERLPDEYYGDLSTLDLNRRDLNHYEFYKVVRHFDSITNTSAKTKAQQYLLKSGMRPNQRILRTCDPADRDDVDATLSGDETEAGRELSANKSQMHEKNDRKKDNRLMNAEIKHEQDVRNREINEEMDQYAEQIALEMHYSQSSSHAGPSNYHGSSSAGPSGYHSSSSAGPSNFGNTSTGHIAAGNRRSSHSSHESSPAEDAPTSQWRPKPQSNTNTDFTFNNAIRIKSEPAVAPVINPAFIRQTKPPPPKTPVTTRKLRSDTAASIQASVAPTVRPDSTPASSSQINRTASTPARPVSTSVTRPSSTAPVSKTLAITPVSKPLTTTSVYRPLAIAPEPRRSNVPAPRPSNAPILIHDNPRSSEPIEEPNRKPEQAPATSETLYYKPYKSVLNSLGLSAQKPLDRPKSTTLCNAESSGGVCKDKDCPFTHFKDFK